MNKSKREIHCPECDGAGWVITYEYSGLPEQEVCGCCNGEKTVSIGEDKANE